MRTMNPVRCTLLFFPRSALQITHRRTDDETNCRLANRLSAKLDSLAFTLNRRTLRAMAPIALMAVMATAALGQNLPNNPQPSLNVDVAARQAHDQPGHLRHQPYSSGTGLWGSGSSALAITPEGWGGDATETYNYLIDERTTPGPTTTSSAAPTQTRRPAAK